MTIKYPDGKTLEAAILTRDNQSIRVAVKGGEDVLELRQVSGTWVTEDLEAVEVQFAWQRRSERPSYSDADFICSHELAVRLLDLLTRDSAEEAPKCMAAGRSVLPN